MSTRERWIVYPLLFLTLGIALRDKIIPPTRLARTRIEANELVVRKLQCVDAVTRTLRCDELEGGQIGCGSLIAGPKGILIAGPAGRPAIAAGTNAGHGVIQTFTASGAPLVRLDALESGGILTTFGYVGKDIRELVFGHVGREFGIFANLPALSQRLRAVLAWQGWTPSLSATRPSPEAKPDSPAAKEPPSPRTASPDAQKPEKQTQKTPPKSPAPSETIK